MHESPQTNNPPQACLLRCILICLILVTPHPAAGREPDWSDYGALLQQYVSRGERAGVKLAQVDYTGLRQDPRFDNVLARLTRFPVQQLAGQDEKLAFYINAYNILALKLVLDNRPLASIKDVGNFLRPVWKRPAGQIDGQTVTLHHIEHEILRKMGEPRVHMAIVCASVSCPDLRPEPYNAKRLDVQLDDQTRLFLANDRKGLWIEGNNVHVSRIFKWFRDDFDQAGGIEEFIRRYIKLPVAIKITADIEYNWSLNNRGGS